jgi:hypothetical protein
MTIMAKDFDPGKFQSYFEKVAETNVKAFEAQTRYFENLLRRNATLMSELTSSRISGLKEITTSPDLSTAIQCSSAVNRETQEKMQQLYEQNLAAWEELQGELKELYTIDNDIIDQMQSATRNLVNSARDKVKSMAPKKSSPAAKPTPKKAAPRKKTTT